MISIDKKQSKYVTPTPILQGKVKITNPHFVTKHPRLPLILPIAYNNKSVQFYVNYFFVNTIRFLHTQIRSYSIFICTIMQFAINKNNHWKFKHFQTYLTLKSFHHNGFSWRQCIRHQRVAWIIVLGNITHIHKKWTHSNCR